MRKEETQRSAVEEVEEEVTQLRGSCQGSININISKCQGVLCEMFWSNQKVTVCHLTSSTIRSTHILLHRRRSPDGSNKRRTDESLHTTLVKFT